MVRNNYKHTFSSLGYIFVKAKKIPSETNYNITFKLRYNGRQSIKRPWMYKSINCTHQTEIQNHTLHWIFNSTKWKVQVPLLVLHFIFYIYIQNSMLTFGFLYMKWSNSKVQGFTITQWNIPFILVFLIDAEWSFHQYANKICI